VHGRALDSWVELAPDDTLTGDAEVLTPDWLQGDANARQVETFLARISKLFATSQSVRNTVKYPCSVLQLPHSLCLLSKTD
jgi:hypothetical protein